MSVWTQLQRALQYCARHRLVAALAAVLLVGVVVVVVVTNETPGPGPCVNLPAPTSSGSGAGRPFVGTLGTHESTAADESRAGIKMAMVEVGWRNLEPRRGEFDTAYAQQICRRVAAYRAAGMEVTLGLGLHYTPQWVLDIPGSRFVDQNGKHSPQVDLVFNRDMRRLADQYLKKVDELIGLQHFWAVRVTSGSVGETLYPSGGSYWAFSDGAQNGPQRPKTMAPNPLPGWRPATNDTHPSESLRGKWLRWYVGGLADAADWQMRTLRELGFTGYLQVLTPGQGLRPLQLPPRVMAGLPEGLLGRGAVWSWLYADLKVRDGVTAYVSSLADGSGNNDHCTTDDVHMPLDSKSVESWSAARWITRIAREQGFTVAGEVPGFRDSSNQRSHYSDPSSQGLAATAYQQAASCGFLGVYWAHDDQVQEGIVKVSTLGQLAGHDPRAPAAAAR
jgi:hypothetical protein